METNSRTDSSGRLHPLVIIAATTLILTCLLAIGVMTGLMPSPFHKETTTDVVVNKPAEPGATTKSSAASTSARVKTTERPATTAAGSTSGAGGSGSVAGGTPATTAAAPCTNCGTVTGVRTVKQQADASMIGPAAGALIGGVLGNQIGSGSGNKIATVVGAGAGAAAGTEIERRYKATTHYVIDVRMDDGEARQFSSPTPPSVQPGAKVKVVDGKLMHG